MLQSALVNLHSQLARPVVPGLWFQPLLFARYLGDRSPGHAGATNELCSQAPMRPVQWLAARYQGRLVPYQ